MSIYKDVVLHFITRSTTIMTKLADIKTGQTITFKLATTLLKDEYQSVVVKGRAVSYEIAMNYEDVASTHENIYSTLPDGTPRYATDYEYMLVKTQAGATKAIGIPWIIDDIKVIESATIRVVVNNVSVGDTTTISKALNAYGLTDFDIEVL